MTQQNIKDIQTCEAIRFLLHSVEHLDKAAEEEEGYMCLFAMRQNQAQDLFAMGQAQARVILMNRLERLCNDIGNVVD